MAKKESKKDKAGVDKVVKKVNKEIEKTSSQIEKLINDALKQFDTLQNQIQEPVRKLLREVDDLREREMRRFHEEMDRRLGELHDLQNTVMERLGLATNEGESAAKKVSKDAAKAAKTIEKAAEKTAEKTAAPAKKKPAAAKAKPKAKPASKGNGKAAPKAAATKAPKAVNKNDLTLVKGIGPATAKKMQDAGITSIEQIANPSAAEQEKLQAFAKMKGFSDWSSEAKKLL
ncbi:helix-hairpin-helix domain-containing protein [Marinobacter xestospongiae]|uniref:helix-hairpin-helix domain-containing protein n=1 Tax=Marinobacter xestospongiae TaxID=994319 RepID=UPI0020037371|nr:helix-hairpin-helix domain-containing protein [Marinobacter xestospongiae]MCK7568602.1 helix-hairpin-helix domain-containing protein [Marinobacter xestospongiae]